METAAQKIQQQSDFEEWCILELFGHQRIAGLVTNASIGGCSFVRVDVPNPDGEGVKYTRYLGNGAIYAINVTTRDEVLRIVQVLYPRPNVPRENEQRRLSGADYDGPVIDEDFEDDGDIDD